MGNWCLGETWDASAFCVPVFFFVPFIFISSHRRRAGNFLPFVVLVCVRTTIPVLEHFFFISLFIVVPVDDECISNITVQETKTKRSGMYNDVCCVYGEIWGRD